MEPAPLPEPADDPLIRLPRSVYWQVVHDLHRSLPDPVDASPEAIAHRINAAIAEVGSMLPANAEEATIATRCVSAHAQAMDCLRIARPFFNDPTHILKCTAQSAAMMRAANSSRSLLLRVQAARHKREADPTTCDKATWTEYCAVGLMLNALGETQSEPPPPPPQPEPAAAEPQPEPADRFSSLTEAEKYAVHYPRRAALIRSLGGVPDNCSFGPPSPDLVQAILASTSPILLELDRQPDLVPA